MFRVFLIALISSLWAQSVFAVHPFRDVTVGSLYYDAVDSLYANRILTDDSSGLFRPDASIDRDAFVGFSVSVSCHACIVPSIDDLVKYQTSPFSDLSKSNPYYYCISYAQEKNIVQGYTLDARGNVSCEDGKVWESAPFCEKNKTTRIESAAMLLRQARLWDDTRNSAFTPTLTITDVSPYWHGYAEKAIQAGILTLKNNKISPDEAITRGEFALMAAKMLAYNQCLPDGGENSLASTISIESPPGTPISGSTFGEDTLFSLVGIIETSGSNTSTSASDYLYRWTAINSVTGERVTYEGRTLPSSMLSSGNWFITMDVVDRASSTTVSRSSTSITIGDGSGVTGGTSPTATILGDGWGNSGDGSGTSGDGSSTRNIPPTSAISAATVGGVVVPSVTLSASDLSPTLGTNVGFSVVSLGVGPLTYSWSFGDGSRTTTTTTLDGRSGGSISHAYTTPGTYTVTVTMTDGNGRSVQSSLVIIVTGSRDSDGDGVSDESDRCVAVKGEPSYFGCPKVETNSYTQGTWGTTNASLSNNGGDNIFVGSTIQVESPPGTPISGSTFGEDTPFSLVGIIETSGSNTSTSASDYLYRWTAINSVTGERVTYEGRTLPSSMLSSGNWFITMDVVDRASSTTVSRSSTSITIGDGSGVTNLGRISSDIIIRDSAGDTTTDSNFSSGDVFSLVVITGNTPPGNSRYSWTAVDQVSGRTITHSGQTLPSSLLRSGNWNITMNIVDISGTTLSTAKTNIVIGDGSGSTSGWGHIDGGLSPSVSLSANTLTPPPGGSVDFRADSIGTGPINYVWNFGDGSTRSSTGGSGDTVSNTQNISHTYATSGVYNVSVAMTDRNGKTSVSQLVVSVGGVDGSSGSSTTSPTATILGDGWGNSGDGSGTSGDGSSTRNIPPTSAISAATVGGVVVPSVTLSASDLSPTLGTNVGFSVVSLGVGPLTYSWSFGDGSRTTTTTTLDGRSGGSISHAYTTPGTYTVTVTMTDGNGRSVQSSLVIIVTGSRDSDGDGVSDESDRCVMIPGPLIYLGCPAVTSLLGTLEKNICIMDKARTKGLVVIAPVCESCPCDNSVSLGGGVRSCDVLFPAILSPDLATIYSRGALFQVR